MTTGVVSRTVQQVIRGVLALLGFVLILIGVPVAIATPFPFVPIGLPIVIAGVVLLGRNSATGKRWMEGVLEKYPKVERFAPNWLMRLVFGRSKEEIMHFSEDEAAEREQVAAAREHEQQGS